MGQWGVATPPLSFQGWIGPGVSSVPPALMGSCLHERIPEHTLSNTHGHSWPFTPAHLIPMASLPKSPQTSSSH